MTQDETIDDVSDSAEETVEVGKETEEEVVDRGDEVVAPAVEEPVAEKEEEPAEEDAPEREKMIPRARFDEVNSKFKELQAQVAALKEAQQPVPSQPPAEPASEVSLSDLHVKAAEALMEGDTTAYGKIQAQIQDKMIAEAEARAEAKFAQRETAKSVADTVKELTTRYPDLDEKTGKKELIDEVVEWRDFFITQKGMTIPEALRKAAERVMASTLEEEEAPEPKQDTRAAAARQKAAAAAQAQPPSLNVVGMGNRVTAVKLDPEKLSEEEFAGLSATEKRRMRGD